MKDLLKWLNSYRTLNNQLKEKDLDILTKLSFENTEIAELHPDINKLPRLRQLYVPGIKLKKLDLHCESLNWINAGANNIKEVKLNCPNLEYLDLSNNNIKNISFNNMKFIQNIYLTDNKLESIELNAPYLKECYLTDNPLRKLNIIAPPESQVYHDDLIIIEESLLSEQ